MHIAKNKRAARGFTLIEICVVVGIVVVLVVILLPIFKTSLQVSYKAKCISNLAAMGQAITLSAADHEGSLPPSQDGIYVGGNWQSTGNSLKSWWGWPYQYYFHVTENTSLTYLPTLKFLTCPADTTSFVNRSKIYTSYSFNIMFFVDYGDGVPTVYSRNLTGRRILLAEAAKKILIIDGVVSDPNSSGGAGAFINDTSVSTRHRGVANALFGDGSVKGMTPAETIEDSSQRYILRDTP